MQRHLHVHFFLRIDALEIDMLYLLAERVHLEVAQQHGFFLAIQIQRQDGSVERFFAQGKIQSVVIEFNHGCLAGAIHHTGDEIRLAQTAARTRSLHLALACADFNSHFTSPLQMKSSATRRFRVAR